MSGLDSDCVAVTPGEIRTAAEVSGGFTYFQNGDVLVAKITPCFENGKTAEVSTSAEHCFGSTEFHVIRVYESRLLPRYLTHYLRQPWIREAGQRRMTGSAGQRRVPRSFLQELRLPLPPLEEQRRIAAILDKADALRQKRRLALQKLDSLTQSVFLDMFGNAMDESSPLVHPLEGVCVRITDGTHQPPKWSPGGLPFLFVSNVRDGKIDFNTQKFISESTYRELTRNCPIEEGDVLYTIVGSYGNAAVVPKGRRFAFQRHIAHLKPRRTLIRPEFLAIQLETRFVKRQADKLARGIAQKTLNLAEIRTFKVLVPEIKAQNLFAARINKIQQQRIRAFSSLARINSMFFSLQRHAFSGEL